MGAKSALSSRGKKNDREWYGSYFYQQEPSSVHVFPAPGILCSQSASPGLSRHCLKSSDSKTQPFEPGWWRRREARCLTVGSAQRSQFSTASRSSRLLVSSMDSLIPMVTP